MKITRFISLPVSLAVVAASMAGAWAIGTHHDGGYGDIIDAGKTADDNIIKVTPAPTTAVAVCPQISSLYSGSATYAALSPVDKAPSAMFMSTKNDNLTLGATKDKAVSTTTDIFGGLVSAEPIGKNMSEPAGTVMGYASGEDERGLVAATCHMPMRSAWFIGASTRLGHTSTLQLTNPSAAPVEVAIKAWDGTGPVDTTKDTIVVRPHDTYNVRLDARYAQAQRLTINVQATGAGVAMSLFTQGSEGLTPEGATFVEPTAQTARRLVMSGVRIGASQSVLRVVNPNNKEAALTVSLSKDGRLRGLPGAKGLKVAPNAVADISLLGVDQGIYSVVVDADRPVAAAAGVGISPQGASKGAVSQGDTSLKEEDSATRSVPAGHDITWVPAQIARSEGMVIIPDGTPTYLSLYSPHATRVALVSDGDKKIITVNGSHSEKIPAGVWMWQADSPVNAGVVAIRDDNEGIAYIRPIKTAEHAGSVGVQLYP